MLSILYLAASVYIMLQCGKKNKKGGPPKSEVPQSAIDKSESAAPAPAPAEAPEEKKE